MAGRNSAASRGSALGKLWGKAREEAKSGGAFGEAVPLDSGKYKMQFVKHEIGDFGGKRQAMLYFAVVAGESDVNGTVCKMWLVLDEEDRVVWLARALAAMGVDIDSAELKSEDDLAAIFDDLIANNTVCAVKVREKDGYTNMYLNGLADVADTDLLDPDEVAKALEGGGKPKHRFGSKPAAEPEESGDGDAVAEGDRVTWKEGKKVLAGEIVAFDKDDNAMVRPDGQKKTVTLSLDVLEKEGGGDGGGDGESAVEEGSVVTAEVDGKPKSGVVVSIDGDKASVKFRGEAKPRKLNVGDLEVV